MPKIKIMYLYLAKCMYIGHEINSLNIDLTETHLGFSVIWNLVKLDLFTEYRLYIVWYILVLTNYLNGIYTEYFNILESPT